MAQSAGASTPAASTDTTPALLCWRAGFREQTLDDLLGLLVLALAEVVLANASARIDEVEGWPVLIPEGTPDCVVVIDRNGILDPQPAHRTSDVVEVPFEHELGCVHSDHDEPFARYF